MGISTEDMNRLERMESEEECLSVFNLLTQEEEWLWLGSLNCLQIEAIGHFEEELDGGYNLLVKVKQAEFQWKDQYMIMISTDFNDWVENE